MNKDMKFFTYYFGAIVIFCFVFSTALFAVMGKQADTAPVQIQEEEYIPILHMDEERQSGFLNSESVMASFSLFEDHDGNMIYMIMVERYGFSNPLYYEVATFEAAEMLLMRLAE